MKEISQEVIEIDNKEYKLFLNRKGIVAYEKYCKEELKDLNEVREKYNDMIKTFESDEVVPINDDTDPFAGLDDINDEDTEKNIALVHKMYVKLYWIMLYENHKLSLNSVEELYNKAVEEYGESQIQALADQMMEEVNVAPKSEEKQNLKNLKALKPKK